MAAEWRHVTGAIRNGWSIVPGVDEDSEQMKIEKDKWQMTNDEWNNCRVWLFSIGSQSHGGWWEVGGHQCLGHDELQPPAPSPALNKRAKSKTKWPPLASAKLIPRTMQLGTIRRHPAGMSRESSENSWALVKATDLCQKKRKKKAEKWVEFLKNPAGVAQ